LPDVVDILDLERLLEAPLVRLRVLLAHARGDPAEQVLGAALLIVQVPARRALAVHVVHLQLVERPGGHPSPLGFTCRA